MAKNQLSDPLLQTLREISFSESFSIELPLTVLVGSARIEGHASLPAKFFEHLREQLPAGIRDSRTFSEAEGSNKAAMAAVAEGLERGMDETVKAIESHQERRRELADRLDSLDEGSDEAKAAQDELDKLGKVGPALTIRQARVYGPGYNPLVGPLEPAFVRVMASSIDAWWLGITVSDDGE